jgi:chitin synthase
LFLVTALLHLPEAYALLHGLVYLAALPAGNLLLIIYSVCNITDRSWGE